MAECLEVVEPSQVVPGLGLRVFRSRSTKATKPHIFTSSRLVTRWWNFKYFLHFQPEPWGNDPIWLYNIFQMGWNHQLEEFDFQLIFLHASVPRWWYHWSKTYPSSWPETQATSIGLGDWNFSENSKCVRNCRLIVSMSFLFEHVSSCCLTETLIEDYCMNTVSHLKCIFSFKWLAQPASMASEV